LVDPFVESFELPLKPVESRNCRESRWSTEANVDDDDRYQKEHSNVAAGDGDVSEETSVTDKQDSGITSRVGSWVDAS
jgi:hypothetical protein